MQAMLRKIQKKEERAEWKTSNCIFVAEKNVAMTLYPIPDFIGECLCKQCGNRGMFLIEGMEPICNECVQKILGSTKMVREDVLTCPSLEGAIRTMVLEWNPNNSEEWYKISGRNIDFTSKQRMKPEDAKKRFLEIMKLVMMGNPQKFDCDYDKENRKLIIYV